MSITITWTTPAGDYQTEVAHEIWEGKLKEDAENYPFLISCHRGALTYRLAITGDICDRVAGRVSCHCGKVRGWLEGLLSDATLTFYRPT